VNYNRVITEIVITEITVIIIIIITSNCNKPILLPYYIVRSTTPSRTNEASP